MPPAVQTNPSAEAQRWSLDDKYLREEGTVYLSGIQALVRVTLDQHRLDRRRGLRTATLVSGYRGSPLGGLDVAFERAAAIARGHEVRFVNGVNEELAATAVFGSQLASILPAAKYDGVLGMWYGKGPGVDRTGDIFKHANFAGVGRHGGVLALGGDDPLSKSSTIPSHSEVAFYDALFPVLFPGSAQEILDLGRLGFELSRYSGLWVGVKIVTNVADEIATAEVGPDRIVVADPGFVYEGRPWQARQNPLLMPPWGLETEREIHYGRLEAAKAFAAANRLNRVTLPTPNAWLGIAAPGKTYYDLREALAELGLDNAALRQYGIRLLKIEMLFPMEPGTIREFSRGLEELLVVEEKRAFCELFIRDILYNQAERPLVIGKSDEHGRPLVPADGELDADRIAQIVAARVERRIHLESITAGLEGRGLSPLMLHGQMGKRARASVMARLERTDGTTGLVLAATASLLGEGFDCPPLDTLFLAFPIKFKGSVIQCVGRVLRPTATKTRVEVHDYVDVLTPVLARMYSERRTAYGALGFTMPKQPYRKRPPGISTGRLDMAEHMF